MGWRKILYAICCALFLFSAGLWAAEPESIVEQIKLNGDAGYAVLGRLNFDF